MYSDPVGMQNLQNKNHICSPLGDSCYNTQPILPKFGQIRRIFLPEYHRPSKRATDKIFILTILHSHRISIHDLTNIWLCTSTKSKWTLRLCVSADFALDFVCQMVGIKNNMVKSLNKFAPALKTGI